MFWRTVGRLILVPLAFVAAGIVAAAVAFTLGVEKLTHAMHGTPEGLETVEAYGRLVVQGWAYLAGLSLVPALAVVIIGEVARVRSWLFYVLGGGLALAVLPFLANIQATDPAAVAPPAELWQVLATAGFSGGLAYWLIAGRSA